MSMLNMGRSTAVVSFLFVTASCGAKPVPPGASSASPPVAQVGASVSANSGPPAADSPLLHWRGKAKNLEIRSTNGAIRAVPSADDEAHVDARVIKNKRQRPVRLRTVETANLTIVCVSTDREGVSDSTAADDNDADDDRDDDDDHHHGGHRGRRDTPHDAPHDDACGSGGHTRDVVVELIVQVPKATKFAGWTINGGVDVAGLDNEVEAHTQNGGVRIDTKGIARASTVNGSIQAKIGASTWTGTLSLESVNGPLAIELPSDVGAELRADTVHGRVRVAPRMDALHTEENHVQGRIGKGGGELRLRTVNGPIDVR